MTESRLPAQIAECGDDVLHTRQRLGALLDAMLGARTADEVLLAAGEMRAVLCGLSATGNRIKAYVGAARMAGMIEPATVEAEALELHPVNRPDRSDATRDLFLRSLHTAGDHTLDPEPGEVAENEL